MRRTIEQWRGTVPKAVVDGSAAQAIYCIDDAKADILELDTEIVRLRKALLKMEMALEYIKGFPAAAKGEDIDYILGLKLSARYAIAALD